MVYTTKREGTLGEFAGKTEKMAETLLESREVFRGKLLAVRVDRVRLPSGREAVREVVAHPGAVAVVPVARDGRVVMVYQYRYPLGEATLEIPAGKIDPGEDVERCARRELAEETGFVAGRLEPLVSIVTTPGFCDETIHIFAAHDLSEAPAGEFAPDEDENLKGARLSRDEILRAIKDGGIRDAKTIAGLLAYFSFNG